MFSGRFRFQALAAVLLGAPGLAAAESSVNVGAGGVDAPVGYRHDSHAAEVELFLDRSEIESLPDLVNSLLNAIAKLSDYQRPSAAPRVSKVSRAQIESTICSGPCAVKAWYLPEDGIFLDDSLMPETNLVHRSILLHELVHYVQEVSADAGSMNACERWLHRERRAYQVQNEYLVRLGNSSGYPLMVGNQMWLATHRNACAGWKEAADARAVGGSAQAFGEDGQDRLRSPSP
jgi:hypothetical protein